MSDLVEVRLLDVPVTLWARSHEQSEALQREFALVAADPGSVPRRLLEVVTSARSTYASETSEQEERMLDAAEQGVEVLPEVVYRVPPVVGQVAQQVRQVFREADEHCREGEHLLTLAPDDDVVAFRDWFLEQFTAQTAGGPPVPWPAYRRA